MTCTKSQQQNYLNPLVMGIMNENNALKLEILNHLIYLSTRFRSVFISQQTLAAKYCVTVRWVNNLLSRWKSLGVIKYRQQGFNRSCIYVINPLLAQEKNRIKFKLPAAVLLLAISSLCSAAFSGEFLLSNNKNIYTDQNSWMVTVQNAGYGFYEQHPSTETIVFSKKQQTTTSIGHQPQEGEAIMNKSVINQISDMYGLSVSQQNVLSGFSEESLTYAFNELKRQNKHNSLNNPVNWIAKVAASYKGQRTSFPKTGNEGGHSSKASNPAGHSPSAELPNLSHIEQVEYLMNEILKFSKTYDPDKVYSPDTHMNEYLHKIATNSITSMQKEVDQLLAAFDDQTHSCKPGCVKQSLFIRAPKQQTTVDHNQSTSDKDYEAHLEQISKDKTNPIAYKELVRKYDYQRTARR